MKNNTRARLIFRFRKVLNDGVFVDSVVWSLPSPTVGSAHGYKYRLALIINGECVLRYDNERGKGDHRHIEGREEPIQFTTLEALIDAFEADVARITK